MREVERIIEAADAAYREFLATDPDREVRHMVGNAVRFPAVDLTAAVEFAATVSGPVMRKVA